MRVLVLASAYPSFHKGTAANVVLASLIEALGALVQKPSWATVAPGGTRDLDTEKRLEAAGARHLGDFTDETEAYALRRPLSSLDALRRAFFPRPGDDYPRYRDPEGTVRRLKGCNADGVILFWDTWFEYLLPALGGLPVVLYGGRPRHAAPLSRLNEMGEERTVMARLRRPLQRRILDHQAGRHLDRLRHGVRLVNICAVDAAAYQERGLTCDYVPNTWPDVFGANWAERRRRAEEGRGALGILGNISGLGQTGNLFGLRYLAERVLPLLDRGLDGLDWEINITGSGTLPPDLAAAFDGARIRVKGYVPDLDSEILANPIFLLLNNAGPYTGGYSRVIYAFSSGACLVAHRRLADSMPEIRHGWNALLGETPEEIASLIKRACGDEALRRALGGRARETYEGRYRPERVASRLISLLEAAA